MTWVCPKCGCGNIDEWKNCKRCDTPKIILQNYHLKQKIE